MDYGEYLRDLEGQRVSLSAQQTAQALLAEFQAPTHIERSRETGESLIKALGMDLIDNTVDLPMRARTYKLHRRLGLSVFQALRHSSPADGIATAGLIVPNQEQYS